MLSRYLNAFFGNNKQPATPINELPTPQLVQLPNTKNTKTVWVYVWRMGTKSGVGHTSIQLDGDAPKMATDDNGTYMSIWPKNFPSYGPLTIIPLQAELAQTLTSDCASEARGPTSTVRWSPPDHYRGQPDAIFKIEGLDTVAMKNEMANIEKQVETGVIKYQLLPNAHLFNWAYKLSANTLANATHDPFSMQPNTHFGKTCGLSTHTPPEVYNCATLVKKLLNAGGLFNIPSSKTPWASTPDNIAESLNQVAHRPS